MTQNGAKRERREINLGDTQLDVMVALAEGNPGALSVLGRMLKGEAGSSLLDAILLDDMNIRGTQIWIAFKDFAKEDFAAFVAAIRARSPEMVEAVNAEGRAGNHDWLAVTDGASFGKRRRLAGAPA